MGLVIALEDEDGNPIRSIEDPRNEFRSLLPSPNCQDFSQIKFVNWYGDTVFNRLQLPTVIAELEQCKGTSEDGNRILAAIIDLCREAAAKHHLYVRFSGD
jgi:hypothetical protein